MRIHRFLIVSLALIVSISVSMVSTARSAAQSDSSIQWGEKEKSGTNGHDVRWGKPALESKATPSSVIRQVQHLQPTVPQAAKPMTPAQRDTIYPELRPKSVTPPSGATHVPMTVENPPSSFSSPSVPNAMQPTATQPKIDATILNDMPQPESAAVQMKNPSLPAPAVPGTGSTPAPRPFDGILAGTKGGKEIDCPDYAASKSIRDISYDIRPMPGTLPKECPLKSNPYTGRHFNMTCYQWKASALCTKAAYFEDVQLERYGHSFCPALEPVISGARFFLTVPMLPYKMGLQTPDECVYTLGHYRVGSCSPYMLDPFPITVRALLFEGAAIGGAIALIP